MQLKPAIVYKDEIIKKSQELFYTEDMMYYNGYLGNDVINIADHDETGELYQYAIIDMDDDLVGYISYRIDWYARCAYSIGLISFDQGNIAIGLAVRKVMSMLIDDLKMHRIEFRCIGGNPVKRHYDDFCSTYNGNMATLHDVFKDKYGNYKDMHIYEIITDKE